MHRPITHDIRRGAAAEVDYYAEQIPGGHTEIVRKALGHSIPSMQFGTTDKYIGDIRFDLWTLRVKNGGLPTNKLDLLFAPTGFRPDTPLRAETTARCIRDGLDPDNDVDRHTAINRIISDKFDVWIADQRQRTDHVDNETPVASSASRDSNRINNLADDTDSDDDLPLTSKLRAARARAQTMRNLADDRHAVLHSDRDTFMSFFSTVNILRFG
jgi:hypothetical protein